MLYLPSIFRKAPGKLMLETRSLKGPPSPAVRQLFNLYENLTAASTEIIMRESILELFRFMVSKCCSLQSWKGWVYVSIFIFAFLALLQLYEMYHCFMKCIIVLYMDSVVVIQVTLEKTKVQVNYHHVTWWVIYSGCLFSDGYWMSERWRGKEGQKQVEHTFWDVHTLHPGGRNKARLPFLQKMVMMCAFVVVWWWWCLLCRWYLFVLPENIQRHKCITSHSRLCKYRVYAWAA